MVKVRFSERFSKIFSKIKDNLIKVKVKKQIKKISKNPEFGKPMKNSRKGTRELYIKPFRLSYSYDKDKGVVYVLDLYHKKKQ